MQNLPEIDNLIKLISKLPGLGPKSAKRIILKMINNRQEILKPLANNLINSKNQKVDKYPLEINFSSIS